MDVPLRMFRSAANPRQIHGCREDAAAASYRTLIANARGDATRISAGRPGEMNSDIYLSPHHDDVCFSLGALVWRRRAGSLVSIFTKSDYVAVSVPLPTDQASRARVVTEMRTAEDLRFAKVCGLVRHDLSLAEPSFVGRDPFDCRDLEPAIARLRPLLASMISDDPSRKAQNLFCPIGIGSHRDHLTTFYSVVAMLPQLVPTTNVFFYEDLHYASGPDVRTAGLRRALHILSAFKCVRIALPLSKDMLNVKMQLVSLYGSQHRQPPSYRRYSVSTGQCQQPHEAVWHIRPSA